MSEDNICEKSICPYYSVGYCKNKDQCFKAHLMEDCANSLWKKIKCHKRHRKQCKYGKLCRRYCKDNMCEFKHVPIELLNKNKEQLRSVDFVKKLKI